MVSAGLFCTPHMKIISIFLAKVMVLLPLPLAQATETSTALPEPQIVHLLVKPKLGTSKEEIKNAYRQTGARFVPTILEKYNLQVLEVPAVKYLEVLEFYKKSNLFAFAETNIFGGPPEAVEPGPRSIEPPTDPLYAYNLTNQIRWINGQGYTRGTYGAMSHDNQGVPISLYQNGVDQSSDVPARMGASIDLLRAREIQESAPNIIIAIVDSGFASGHPDLQGVLWTNAVEAAGETGVDDDGNGITDDLNGMSADGMTGNINDSQTHGTMVAGIIAMVPDNGIGSAGIVRNPRIMAIKTPNFSSLQFTLGIAYAIQNGAEVITCSWGLNQESLALKELFAVAEQEGVLMVAAVVNSPLNYNNLPNDWPIRWKKSVFNPDGFANIIVVTTSMPDDRLFAGAAGYGTLIVDLMGTGAYVLSTHSDGGYAFGNGSSYAVPHVAGVASLVMEHYPHISPAEVIHLLNATVDPGWDMGTNTISGGRLNAYRALAALKAQLRVCKVEVGVELVLENALSNLTYTIERSEDMVNWQFVGSVRGEGTSLSLTDTNRVGTMAMYRYRF